MTTTTPKPPNILLFGGGAIGAVYIYTLLQAHCTVTAVLRSNYAHVAAHGYQLNSIRFGCVSFHPTHTVPDIPSAVAHGPYDYVVVCSKSLPDDIPSQADVLRPALTSPDTAIVLIQNGIDIESALSTSFPSNPLISCVVYLPSTQTAPGVIDYGYTQSETLNLLELGTFPSSAPQAHKDAAARFAALVNLGGGVAEVHDDVQVARWAKLAVNAAWNPITALSRCTDADFLRSSPGAVELVRGVMYEVVSVAEGVGVKGVTRSVVEWHLSRHRKRVVGKAPSMLVDVLEGRAFEVEVILGNLVRRAHGVGVKVPLLEALYVLARGLFVAGEEERRRGKEVGVVGEEREKTVS